MRLIYSILLCFMVCISHSQTVLQTVEWGNRNRYVRLFYEDSGEIKEKERLPSGKWTQGTFDYSGYSISAITYEQTDRKFRAYVGNDNHIQEYIDTGSGWSLGDFYVLGEIAHASYYFDTLGTLHIKVYVIRATGDVYEYNYDEAKLGLPGKGWDDGTYLYTLP